MCRCLQRVVALLPAMLGALLGAAAIAHAAALTSATASRHLDLHGGVVIVGGSVRRVGRLDEPYHRAEHVGIRQERVRGRIGREAREHERARAPFRAPAAPDRRRQLGHQGTFQKRSMVGIVQRQVGEATQQVRARAGVDVRARLGRLGDRIRRLLLRRLRQPGGGALRGGAQRRVVTLQRCEQQAKRIGVLHKGLLHTQVAFGEIGESTRRKAARAQPVRVLERAQSRRGGRCMQARPEEVEK